MKQIFDNFGHFHGSMMDHADGSTTVMDSLGNQLCTMHPTATGGYVTNPMGVIVETFHNTTTGVQHLDSMGALKYSTQSFGGKVNFLDSMNQSFASFDPLTTSVSTALGSLRFRIV